MTSAPWSGDDATWLPAALSAWDRTRRWSLRGGTPHGALVRHLAGAAPPRREVLSGPTGGPQAVVEVSSISARDGVGELSLLVHPGADEAVAAAIRAAVADTFAGHDGLRKLVVWSFVDEIEPARWLGEAARQVGRMVGHERRGPGRHVDQLVHEVWPWTT